MTKRTTTVYAQNHKQGMTAGEVRAAVGGRYDDAVVKVTVNLRGGIREIKIIGRCDGGRPAGAVGHAQTGC